MSTLNVRLNDFDAQLLNSLVETTGQSKTSLVMGLYSGPTCIIVLSSTCFVPFVAL